MNLFLEFSDSEVGDIEFSDGVLRVRFSAAFVLRSNESAQTPTPGYARSVELVLAEASSTELPPGLIGRIAHGHIAVGDGWLTRLPLPYTVTGATKLELALANGATLSVSGSAIRCDFTAEPNFTESLFC